MLPILNNNQTLAQPALALELNIRSRSKSYYQGQAATVTSINDTGVFDVLPMHANFISLIKSYVLLDGGMPTEKKIEFKTAVMSVIGGKVDVYVEV